MRRDLFTLAIVPRMLLVIWISNINKPAPSEFTPKVLKLFVPNQLRLHIPFGQFHLLDILSIERNERATSMYISFELWLSHQFLRFAYVFLFFCKEVNVDLIWLVTSNRLEDQGKEPCSRTYPRPLNDEADADNYIYKRV
jgi:hypothetical protein